MKRCITLAILIALAGCTSRAAGTGSAVVMSTAHSSASTSGGKHGQTSTIHHIVVITMENRSFDSYFAEFPGANGIQLPGTCNLDPKTGICVYPYHDTSLTNYGGPHSSTAYAGDLDGGKLDGFIATAETQPQYADPNPDEVMGYHTCAEIPVYCAYATKYALADEHFAATTSWSTMAHLYLVSGWSASCSKKGDPMSCVSNNDINFNQHPDYAWTDITWLLHAHNISWGYFVYPKTLSRMDLRDDENDGEGPDIIGLTSWNPLPDFDDVRIDNETNNIQAGSNFPAEAAAGTLPAVSWVIPGFEQSDHPSASIAKGQAWVKKQVDAVMNGPDWPTTLIILNWDEWGGFYDHVAPPVIDGQGYGFRTPLILIGPMVKQGYIDHQLLSSDAYLKLIEDVFLGSERIDVHDGRPDSRPDVRENTPGLGDLRNDLM